MYPVAVLPVSASWVVHVPSAPLGDTSILYPVTSPALTAGAVQVSSIRVCPLAFAVKPVGAFRGSVVALAAVDGSLVPTALMADTW